MITISPIAYVQNARNEVSDDNWGEVVSTIELVEDFPADALAGITDFSHAEILFYFDRVDPQKIESSARHPRNNPNLPLVGIFAQRGKNRPNRLGATIVRVLSQSGRQLRVQGLDAVNGTPVLDIKPVMREFLPIGECTQPAWVDEIMRNYWGKA